MTRVGYLSYDGSGGLEPRWLAEGLGWSVQVADAAPSLNLTRLVDLPSRSALRQVAESLHGCDRIVAEGLGGLLWAAVLRASGWRGRFYCLPYLNPRSRFDLCCIAVYRRFARTDDRICIGSRRSAALLRGLGVDAEVAEPYGIDCDWLDAAADPKSVAERLGIGLGPMLLYAGRFEPDKDVMTMLRVALKARILLPNLQVVIASHVLDPGYAAAARERLAREPGLRLLEHPPRADLAALLHRANCLITASTSHFETFGRAPAEALACGTPTIAPRYDGFIEVLAQEGGHLTAVQLVDGTPQADECQLLRSVYGVLSGLIPTHRTTIRTRARRRFCRWSTLRVLADGSSPGERPAPAPLPLPAHWRSDLAKLGRLPPAAALRALWTLAADGESAGADEAELRRQVRLRLAGFAEASPDTNPPGTVEAAACP